MVPAGYQKRSLLERDERVGQEGASVVLEGREKMLFQVRTPSPPICQHYT